VAVKPLRAAETEQLTLPSDQVAEYLRAATLEEQA
jgi:hypothetical protein